MLNGPGYPEGEEQTLGGRSEAGWGHGTVSVRMALQQPSRQQDAGEERGCRLLPTFTLSENPIFNGMISQLWQSWDVPSSKPLPSLVNELHLPH